MAPTGELSRQIVEEATLLCGNTDITLLEVVGGIDYREQAEGLKQGADIVIGTPGRIIDYYKQGIFKTKDIKFLVIDEADRLLDMGFEKDMRFILRKLPSYEKRQSMLFSATLSYRVLEMTYEFMNLPEFISVIPDQVTVAGIEQSLYHVGLDRKFPLLLGLLKRENFTRALMFVNMKIDVERLARRLKANGFLVAASQPLSTGKHTIVFDFQYEGGGIGRSGTGTLLVDGKQVAQNRIEHTIPVRFSLDEGLDIGQDTGTPVSDDYDVPFNFTGRLDAVTIDLKMQDSASNAGSAAAHRQLARAMSLRE